MRERYDDCEQAFLCCRECPGTKHLCVLVSSNVYNCQLQQHDLLSNTFGMRTRAVHILDETCERHDGADGSAVFIPFLYCQHERRLTTLDYDVRSDDVR